jgi:DNA repair exonuclease SbcCD ATPase subunit
LNGVDFSVARSKSATKSGLVFRLEETDLTTQSPKETQAIIEERLGISQDLLSRVVFHGQHGLNGLLESTDSEFKDQLALVVPLAVWHSVSSIARKRASEAKKKSNELSGMLAIRTADLEKAQIALERSRDEVATFFATNDEHRTHLSSQIKQLADDSGGQRETNSQDDLEILLENASAGVRNLQAERRSREDEHVQAVRPLELQLSRLQTSLSSLDRAYDALVRERIILVSKVCQVEDRLRETEKMWDLDLSDGVIPDSVDLPELCPTCKQPLLDHGTSHHSEALQKSIQSEAFDLLSSSNDARRELEALEKELAATTKTRDDISSYVAEVKDNLDSLESSWAAESSDLDNRLELALARKDDAVLRLSQHAKRVGSNSRLSNLKSQLEVLEGHLASSQSVLLKAQEDADSLASVVQDLQSRLGHERHEAATLATLTDVTGPRGIQAFVLSNAVRQLQSLTQGYLDDLSDGSLRLNITIDSGDRIIRRALVREADGDFQERSLSSLSGGQWRRCSLALTLGFVDLVSRRGQFRTSVLFLDEPLTHLDRSGRADVGRLLRRLLPSSDADVLKDDTRGMSRLQFSTIVLILQDLAAEELEEAFDCIDVVVKESGKSSVEVNQSS